jgi:hypothetical protein
MWFKGVELSKEGILVPSNALDRTLTWQHIKFCL